MPQQVGHRLLVIHQNGSEHMVTHVVGIDPGLVHTGVVHMMFNDFIPEIRIRPTVINGLDVKAIRRTAGTSTQAHIFIESYRPRSNLSPDRRMLDGVANIRTATGGKTLDNMGVKKVVRRPLMDLLGVWSFSTTTHHQDLRSAARIAIYGMLKDPALNTLVADVVKDKLEGNPWDVVFE